MSKKSAPPSKKPDPNPEACVFLLGPTACGKTTFLDRLARRLPIEVISCDSMQVYRGLACLTQAPNAAQMRRVPTHLVGHLGVHEEYDAARFARSARLWIRRIVRRGKIPVVAGGTAFYATALLDGLFSGPAADETLRRRLADQAGREGVAALYGELAGLDPEAARVIHPNDLRRIIRALEVIHTAGRKFSDLKKERRGIWGAMPVRVHGLLWERKLLYERINLRAATMMNEGAVAEVRRVSARRVSKTASACLGLREIRDYLAGRQNLLRTTELIQMNTRRFAKRQMSWLKRDERIGWIRLAEEADIAHEADRLAGDLRKWARASLPKPLPPNKR
ncbi:MAG: tRNA (adenosine(37)-N6)-dimethylallyltransferase MiaA [Candidatus Omnitrophica bacterium]|nr:tRNA (adenosine(37)-N6)-dimethylallyltransferase MiaA [Candidatus Omnitrophota bacterium]